MIYDDLKIQINTDILLPVTDLEQVSPDSVHSNSNEDGNHTNNYSKSEDLESPAFEPIRPVYDKSESVNNDDDDNMDISDGDELPQQFKTTILCNIDEARSNISSISGLTSNTSDCSGLITEKSIKTAVNESKLVIHGKIPSTFTNVENIFNPSGLVDEEKNTNSILSQVSSSSRLSVNGNNNTDCDTIDGENKWNHPNIIDSSDVCNYRRSSEAMCPYNISEEAQMQKFSENSSSNDLLNNYFKYKQVGSSFMENTNNFDINRSEIRFEGTDRSFSDVNVFKEENIVKKTLKDEKKLCRKESFEVKEQTEITIKTQTECVGSENKIIIDSSNALLKYDHHNTNYIIDEEYVSTQ